MAKMTATIAKELLLPIPKEDFLVGDFTDFVGKCCAIGHLVRLKSNNPEDFGQSCSDFQYSQNGVNNFVRTTVREFIDDKYGESATLSTVNNNNDINGYTQDNPKDRVMALLDDMINEEK